MPNDITTKFACRSLGTMAQLAAFAGSVLLVSLQMAAAMPVAGHAPVAIAGDVPGGTRQKSGLVLVGGPSVFAPTQEAAVMPSCDCSPSSTSPCPGTPTAVVVPPATGRAGSAGAPVPTETGTFTATSCMVEADADAAIKQRNGWR